MIDQYRFILNNKRAILVSDVNNGTGYVCVEAGNIWKISAYFSQFYCRSKSALKNQSLKNHSIFYK